MFSVDQKRQIANMVQLILRDTRNPELPEGEIAFNIKVYGDTKDSWADIKNNGRVPYPSGNPVVESVDNGFPARSAVCEADLRDTFAGQALIGLLSCAGNRPVFMAESAYVLADSMMRERDR